MKLKLGKIVLDDWKKYQNCFYGRYDIGNVYKNYIAFFPKNHEIVFGGELYDIKHVYISTYDIKSNIPYYNRKMSDDEIKNHLDNFLLKIDQLKSFI